MRSASLIAAFAAALLTAAPLHAQQTLDSPAPRAGSWAAEAVYGDGLGANLLYFSSPTSAWLTGLSFNVMRETQDVLTFPGGNTTETGYSGYVAGRLGRRWWNGTSSERFRPLRGVGLLGSLNSSPSFRRWDAGAYGELGGTWFFTPHLSLGASGQLSAGYEHQRMPSGTATIPDRVATSWTVGGSLVRLAAGVYF